MFGRIKNEASTSHVPDLPLMMFKPPDYFEAAAWLPSDNRGTVPGRSHASLARLSKRSPSRQGNGGGFDAQYSGPQGNCTPAMLMGHRELIIRETAFGPDGQGQAVRRRSVNMVGSEDFTHPTMQPRMSQES